MNMSEYKEKLRQINNEAHRLAIRQLELIQEAYKLGKGLIEDVEPFPVIAEYTDEPVKIFRFKTPLFPPRLKVSLSLYNGCKGTTSKKDPYTKWSTMGEVQAVWESIVHRAIEQAKVPTIRLKKALVAYDYAVNHSMYQDCDAFDVRIINNALSISGILEDDNYNVLTVLKRMQKSTDKSMCVSVIEQTDELDSVVKLLDAQ